MKKFFSIASALMLALGLGMTSCSNEIDEVQAPVEQQPELHKLYLSATAPDSPETRAYVEGVEGKDAIKITGWKDGDAIYGIYQIVTYNSSNVNKYGEPGKVKFTFNGSTKEFESEPTSVNQRDIKYFIHGDVTKIVGSYNVLNLVDVKTDIKIDFAEPFLTVDVENNFTDLPLYGEASVVGGKLTTNMQLVNDLAFVCLHNSISYPIDVKLVMNNGSEDKYVTGLRVEIKDGKAMFQNVSASTGGAKITIPAKGKAYLPIQTSTNHQYTYKVMVGSFEFASKDDTQFQAGKVYKLDYLITTGSHLTNVGGVYYGIKWVQLWADGPKFAECNVGSEHLAPEDAGGYYTWGGTHSIVHLPSPTTYNDGMVQLTGDNDIATRLWGSPWRMPTKAELEALLANCNVEYTSVNGVSGYRFTGKVKPYNANSIFLPAAGYCGHNNNGTIYSDGKIAYYWSSTPYHFDDVAYNLALVTKEVTGGVRRAGFSVRAVMDANVY